MPPTRRKSHTLVGTLSGHFVGDLAHFVGDVVAQLAATTASRNTLVGTLSGHFVGDLAIPRRGVAANSRTYVGTQSLVPVTPNNFAMNRGSSSPTLAW